MTAYQFAVIDNRQALLGLQTPDVPASGVLVVYSKPELPVLVEKHNTHCSVFYPIWLPDGASRAYTAAFIQVGMVTVSRHNSCTHACITLHTCDSGLLQQLRHVPTLCHPMCKVAHVLTTPPYSILDFIICLHTALHLSARD